MVLSESESRRVRHVEGWCLLKSLCTAVSYKVHGRSGVRLKSVSVKASKGMVLILVMSSSLIAYTKTQSVFLRVGEVVSDCGSWEGYWSGEGRWLVVLTRNAEANSGVALERWFEGKGCLFRFRWSCLKSYGGQ